MYLELAETLLLAYDHRHKAKGAIGRLIHILQNGRTRILVLGAGGAGKTTLEGYLQSGDTSTPRPYVASPTLDRGSIQGVPLSTVYVVPGQETRRSPMSMSSTEVVPRLVAGDIAGIIVVVANGYHTPRFESYKEYGPKLPNGKSASELSLAEFATQWQKLKWAEELQVLREWKPHIIAANTDHLWLLTLVSKQDLWWTDRAAVKAHYTDSASAWQKELDDIVAGRGTRGFASDTLSASLAVQNLRTAADGIIWPTNAGYDEPLKDAHLSQLTQYLLDRCHV